ncbi:diguanylate cyclase [Billgrantia tianxiuensis]|uniref:Diguanylate cyclase n=1 Tax=Billgrantia tianxiuensis TaxID=2497861 RepID=A0A6I6SVH9_9GAMM|nr:MULTISPECIES: diguanylate cyclase [Halomonas]MCE8035362.1 diguanylate cyclase [Halomonas sp. MCCC 1A11057]QHC51840.1 diguanylate cyclase [Halomonas tianxiuensis]
MPAPIHPVATRLLTALAMGSQALTKGRFWGDGVDTLLREIGLATGASRVWIFQLLELQEHAVIQDYVFEWAAAPHYRQLTHKHFRFFSTAFHDPLYRRMVEERQRGMSQHFITARMAHGPLRENLESQHIRSMVTVPIMIDDGWWGTLGIDDCERELEWEGGELEALVVAAELIASAIYRHQLSSRRRQLELFQQVTDCGIWEIDLASGSTWCSRALLLMLGYPDGYARLPLRRLLAHIMPTDRQRLWLQLRECLARSRQSCRLDVRLHSNGVLPRWHELVAELTLDENGRPSGISGLVIDITRRKQGEERARIAAEYDELTGVMNRRGLTRRLHAALDEPQPAACHLLLLDIDHFKQINDGYGHPAGDALLRQLATQLSNELRGQDALARVGGEEFAILVSGLDDAQALQLGERLRASVADTPFPLQRLACDVKIRHIDITVSIGIAALCPDQEPSHAQALATAQADQALYAAKHAGRNRVLLYGQHANVPDPQEATDPASLHFSGPGSG